MLAGPATFREAWAVFRRGGDPHSGRSVFDLSKILVKRASPLRLGHERPGFVQPRGENPRYPFDDWRPTTEVSQQSDSVDLFAVLVERSGG
jgi:hypothetical protein